MLVLSCSRSRKETRAHVVGKGGHCGGIGGNLQVLVPVSIEHDECGYDLV